MNLLVNLSRFMVRERAKELIDKVLHSLDRVKCEVCQSKFSNFDSLSRHMRKFHVTPVEKMRKEYPTYAPQNPSLGAQ